MALIGEPTFPGINAKSRFGRSALHYAAWDGQEEVVAALLQREDFTMVNAKECYGRTALHCAALNGHSEVCRLLLAHPDFTEAEARDKIGNLTAQELAMRCGCTEAVQVISERTGAPVLPYRLGQSIVYPQGYEEPGSTTRSHQ